MKRLVTSLILVIPCCLSVFAQQTVSIGTNSTNPKAVLWLNSPGQNQGLIIPVVSSKVAVGATTEKGMVVFDDSDKKIWYYNGSPGGWIEVGGGTVTLSGDITGPAS